jgi:hypothetical protein
MSPFEFRRWLDCESSGEAPLRLLAVPRVESGRSEPRIRRLSCEEIRERFPSLLFSSGADERSDLFSLDRSEPASTGEAMCSLLAARVPVVELCLPRGRPDPATWFDDLTKHATPAT